MIRPSAVRLATIAAAASLAATAAFAAAPPLQISYPTDGSLSCDALLAEVARMDELMGVSAGSASSAEGTARATEMGAAAALTGALHTGALGRVPGLGMFANQASAAARRRADEEAARHQEMMRTAEARRALVSGLYQGRNCDAPPPAPEPVVAVAPAETPAVVEAVVAAETEAVIPTDAAAE